MDASIPPWLNVGPTDYLHAVQAGGAAGLGIAEAQNRAREAANRLAAAQQEQAARMQEAQRAAAQREWEFGERMRQAAEENASSDAFKREQLAQTGRYQEGMLSNRDRALADAMERAAMQNEAKGQMLDLRAQHYGDLQDWRNRELALREEAAQNKMRPTDYETVTEETPAVPGEPGTPAIPGEQRSLLGIDWLMPDKPAIPANPGTPTIPKITHTRRVPINQPQEGSLMDSIANPALDEEPDSDAQSGIPVVTSKAEFDALPSGAIYINNGKSYQKP